MSSAALLMFAIVAAFLTFDRIWHRSALADAAGQPGGWLGVVVVVLTGAVIHETLHAVSWKLTAHAPWRSIVFTLSWRKMGFIARPMIVMPVSAYRFGVALPVLVLGVAPIAFGLCVGNGLVLLWGSFFWIESFSDVTKLLATGRVRGDAGLRENADLSWQVVDVGSRDA